MQALTDTDPRQIAEFTLVGRLGGGGMGMVYLGRRDEDDAAAAVKVIRPDLLADDDVRTRFDREAAAAMRVRSARVAEVLGAGFDDGRAYLACEYIEGPTLDSAIVRNGPLAESALVELATGLSEALIDIHGSGLVHRDLTPRNVLLTYAGPRVIDFGIAYVDENPSMTSTGSIIGTPGYVAPERLRDQLSIPAGDVFAVGALLAYAATGRSPYGGGTPLGIHMRVAEMNPTIDIEGVPASFEQLIRDCLASDPADRPDAWALSERVAEIAGKIPRAGSGRTPRPRTATAAEPPAVPAGHIASDPALRVESGLAAAPTMAGDFEPTLTDIGRPPRGRRRSVIVAAVVAILLVAGVAVAVAAPWKPAGHPTAGTGRSSAPASSPSSKPSVPTSPTARSTSTGSAAPTTASADATPPANGLAPGVRQVNQQFLDNGILQLTLTTVQVGADGTVTATVRYHNISIIPVPLVCSTVTDPTVDTITLSDGTKFRAAHSYCSDHPAETITVNPDDTFDSYATFTQVAGPSGPGVLDWQIGNSLSGEVSGIEF